MEDGISVGDHLLKSEKLEVYCCFVDLSNGRRSNEGGEFTHLLLVIPTALTCLQVSLCLPERDGRGLSRLAINQRENAFKSLLLLHDRKNGAPCYFKCFIELDRVHPEGGDSCVHGSLPFSISSGRRDSHTGARKPRLTFPTFKGRGRLSSCSFPRCSGLRRD